MSKKLILCALVLTIAAAAPALAEAPDADVAAVLGIATELCDAPAATVELDEPTEQPMANIVFEPVGEQCGTRVCTKGFFCCNLSCSICAPQGGGCTQQVC